MLPVSRYLCEAIRSLGIDVPFEVVPNVVDASIFFPPDERRETKERRLLFVGNLERLHHKGFPTLLQALARLGEQGHDWQLDVIGDGTERVQYETSTSALGLAERVTFHGSQPKHVVAQAMRTADLLVQPSRVDNLPSVVVEALASGLPVVSTTVGGIPELVGEGSGTLVSPDDPVALAGAIDRTLDAMDTFDRAAIAATARGRYGLEVVGAETLANLRVRARGFAGRLYWAPTSPTAADGVTAPSMSQADYYDEFADRQLREGINARHMAIDRWLERFGLAQNMDVLEIGCGVGTQTELIAKRLAGSGSLTAIDLSPRSAELARSRVSRWPNVRLIAGDVVELDLDETFDVVVMPDVIEHIPLGQHPGLFANVRSWLRDTGWALVHMPNPFYLQWCQQNRPDALQALDQPVFTDVLLANAQSNDLYVHYLETYAIWVAECDYQVIVLRPTPRDLEFGTPQDPDQSVRARLARASRRIPGFNR